MVTKAVILGLVLAFVGTGVANASGPPRIPIGQRRFDHARHEAAAAVAKDGKRAKAACADCHQMDAKGTRKAGKEHDFRCVKCHVDPETCTADMKVSKPTSPGYRCSACHEMKQCKPPDMPPTPPKSFQAGFNHPQHIGFGAAIEKDCANCHQDQAPAGSVATVAGAGHASCSDCHRAGGRSKLVMTDCQGCHKPPMGRAANTDPWRLATFDHQKHHAVATKNAAPCTTCHAAIKDMGSATGAVPRPAMKACLDSCHNGTKAFSAVGTKCTTCHTAQNGKPVANDKTQVFSHAAHIKRNVNMTKCDACHSIKADGNLDPPGEGKQHMPCAASGCHQTEYLTKTTKICGVCHEQSMPWQKAVARMNDTRKDSEYFENINHSTHLQKKGTTNSACGDCHGDKLGGGKKPQGHDACIQCHGKGAPAHDMTECGKCHFATKPASMTTSEWSVAATFVHEKHATDPKTKRTSQCVGCHADVKNSKDLSSVKKPTMQSCDSCHDGKSAFKTTGYECARCHSKAQKASTPQAMTGFNAPNQTAMLEVRPR